MNFQNNFPRMVEIYHKKKMMMKNLICRKPKVFILRLKKE